MQIFWSEPAKNDYWSNIEYLEKEWTLVEVYNFIDKTEALIGLLKKGNINFKPTAYLNTFQVPVVTQITLYYRINNNTIELLRFWSNYQDLNQLIL